jgi:hypothetical protein
MQLGNHQFSFLTNSLYVPSSLIYHRIPASKVVEFHRIPELTLQIITAACLFLENGAFCGEVAPGTLLPLSLAVECFTIVAS